MIRHTSALASLALTCAVACSSGSSTPPDTAAPTVTITKSDGGKLTASDGKVSLSVPQGAVTADVKVTVDVLAQIAATASAVYQFAPEGTEFAVPAVVSISSSGITVPTGKKLDFARKAGERWLALETAKQTSGGWEAQLTTLTTVALVLVDAETSVCASGCMAASGAVCCTTCGCQGATRCTPTCSGAFKWDCEIQCCFDYKTFKCQ